MKWTILVVIFISVVIMGLSSILTEPDSARALDDLYQKHLYLQGEVTLTPSITPSATPTPGPTQNYAAVGSKAYLNGAPPIYLPLIRSDPSPTPTATPTSTPVPLPPKEFLVCSSPGQAIPDGTTSGLRADIAMNEPGVLLDLDVYVRINHTYVGDLALELVQRGPDNTTAVQSSVLVDRPGLANDMLAMKSAVSLGCELDNIQAIFDSQAEQYAENKCESTLIGVAVGGTFKAKGGLDQFRGQPASGTWSLLVSDGATFDTGTLTKWCLHGWAGGPAAPVVTPEPINLPASFIISGVTGQGQSRPLSCESRSAVDWAKFFGQTIGEIEFLNKLPSSDNPDVGFVGNVYGTWGQIPPNDYGVHAEPVAKLLRSQDYGLPAIAREGLTFDELRAEIANGRPVIVWIAGNVQRGAPEYYRAQSDQGISVVARYEHTVIAYGYDASNVWVQNGGNKVPIKIDQFLDSWSALGNMAVLAQP